MQSPNLDAISRNVMSSMAQNPCKRKIAAMSAGSKRVADAGQGVFVRKLKHIFLVFT